MSEEQTKAEEEKPATTDNDAGIQPEADSLIKRADSAAQRLKEENDRMEKLLKQKQELESRAVLMGRSEREMQPEKKEETAAEYAKRVMSNRK